MSPYVAVVVVASRSTYALRLVLFDFLYISIVSPSRNFIYIYILVKVVPP